jgi:HK97 family phage prohead protease
MTMTKSKEIRSITESVGDRDGVAYGYALRFDKLSQNLGGFVEQISPAATSKTLQESDVRALFNHDSSMLLGRTSSGTLRLTEDRDGLAYEIDLPDTSVGNDVRELLRRGDISGSSFGFRVIEDSWTETRDGFPLRTIEELALIEVSPVTFPAEARSLDLHTLIEAAESNNLAEALRASAEEEESDETDSGRVNPTVVRRSSWNF